MKKVMVVFLIIIVILPSSVFALTLSCHSCVLMDMDSGRIIYEKNKDDQRLIASITKIMTAIIAIEKGNLEDTIIVGEEVLEMYGSNIYIEIGEKIKLIDLLYGLMLRSGNDAAIVIATYIGGNEENFVKMMNEKAQNLGMKNTFFNNCHGLDEKTQNKSTAYDMALLSSYAYSNPIYKRIIGTKKYSVITDKKTYAWTNRNKLLFSYKYATGGKTGYTPSAGRTLVTNASYRNLNLTAVTLNDGNEYISHEAMYNYCFENYTNYRILDKNRFRIDTNYYKDKVYIKNDFSYPLTEVEKEKIKVVVSLTKLEDYRNDEEIGTVNIYLDGEEIYNDKVYVSINKIRTTIFDRIKEWIFD